MWNTQYFCKGNVEPGGKAGWDAGLCGAEEKARKEAEKGKERSREKENKSYKKNKNKKRP